MTQTIRHPLYRRQRFPTEVTAQTDWLYLRLPLSLRMVEDLLAARGMACRKQVQAVKWQRGPAGRKVAIWMSQPGRGWTGYDLAVPYF